MARPFKCPFCGATESVSKGVRKTKTMGVRRIRLCKACGKKFTPKNQKAVEASGAESEEQEEKQRQEAQDRAKPSAEPQEESDDPAEADPPGDSETPSEPAGVLAGLFPPPDEQWTS